MLQSGTGFSFLFPAGMIAEAGFKCNANPALDLGNSFAETSANITPVDQCGSFSFNGEVDLSVDTVYTVEIGAQASNYVTYSSGASASAFIDPCFTVDPTFVGADGYTIVLSAGIGNAAQAVPKPSTLPLLGGVVAAWLMARRRARQL